MNKLNITFYVFLILSCTGSPSEPVINDEGLLQKHWNTPINLIDTPDTTPLVVEDLIIYSGERDLVALDITSGAKLWSYEIGEGRALNSCYISYDKQKGQVFFSHDEDFRVLDIKSGELILQIKNIVHPCGSHQRVPQGYAVVGDTTDGYLVDFDGTIRREVNLSMGTASIEYSNNKLYFAQVETVNGALTKGRIYAMDLMNGDSLWAYNTDYGGFHWAKPVIENGILYAGTYGNSPTKLFMALDIEAGEPVWEYITQDPFEYTEDFIVGPSSIYIRSSAYAFVLDKATGEKVWDFKWTSATGVNPIYLGGFVYLSNHYTIFILDAETGELVHEEPLPNGGGYFWELAASDSLLFAQTSSQIIAYEPWHLREVR